MPKSEEFVEFVNMEIDKTKPLYSESDIISPTRFFYQNTLP